VVGLAGVKLLGMTTYMFDERRLVNDNYSFRIATIRNCRGSRINSGLTWPLARG
jgi:hypothetical protein